MISLLAAAVLVSILSAMVLMFYRRKGGRKSLDKVRLLLLADIGMSGSSTILFKRLDTIVHSDLYRFGLEFDLGWAMPYWTYASLALGCIGITIVATVVSVVLVVLRASVIARDVSAKLVSSVFFSAGIVSLVFSIYFSSSILAFIGLGLVFWGALMLYVRSEDYVKEILLVKTTLPMLQNLEYLLTKLDYKGKAIYLPPKYLKDVESSRIYMNKNGSIQQSSLEKITDRQEDTFIEISDALITPPGAELALLFEKSLGTSFIKVDLEYLVKNIPKLLVGDLEIAEEVEIQTIGANTVQVRIKNAAYKELWEEGQKLPRIWSSMGFPLVSATACILAKATGKLVVIERNRLSKDFEWVNTEYRLL